MSYDNNPRYEKTGEGEYRDLETGDLIIEVPDETARILNEAFGLEPDEDGTFRLTEEAFQAIFEDPLRDLYSDESDLNDL